MKYSKAIPTQINTTMAIDHCSFIYILRFSNNLCSPSLFGYPTPPTEYTRCPLSKSPLVDFYWPSESYFR